MTNEIIRYSHLLPVTNIFLYILFIITNTKSQTHDFDDFISLIVILYD